MPCSLASEGGNDRDGQHVVDPCSTRAIMEIEVGTLIKYHSPSGASVGIVVEVKQVESHFPYSNESYKLEWADQSGTTWVSKGRLEYDREKYFDDKATRFYEVLE